MMYDTLDTLCRAMACIRGVKTCKVGFEPNISPSDFPMIRIVPVRLIPGKPYYNRTSETDIFYGENITESEGLSKVYERLLDLDGEIIKVLKANDVRYIETITDQDRLESTYKLMAIRCEIQAERPPVT